MAKYVLGFFAGIVMIIIGAVAATLAYEDFAAWTWFAFSGAVISWTCVCLGVARVIRRARARRVAHP